MIGKQDCYIYIYQLVNERLILKQFYDHGDKIGLNYEDNNSVSAVNTLDGKV